MDKCIKLVDIFCQTEDLPKDSDHLALVFAILIPENKTCDLGFASAFISLNSDCPLLMNMVSQGKTKAFSLSATQAVLHPLGKSSISCSLAWCQHHLLLLSSAMWV